MSTFAPTETLKRTINELEVDISLGRAETLDGLAKKGCLQTVKSTDLEWNVSVGGGDAAWGAFTNSGTASNTSSTVSANVSIGSYKVYHKFGINKVVLQNAKTRGVGSQKRLLERHIKDALRVIRRKVNEALWLGDGTANYGGVVGLGVVTNNTLPYANINPATWSNWIAQIIENGGVATALTKATLMDLKELIHVQETDFDCIFTSPATAKAYNTLFDSIAGDLQLTNGYGSGEVDLGTGDRYWHKVPLMEDSFTPNGQIITMYSPDIEVCSFDMSDADYGMMNRFGFNTNIAPITSAEVNGLNVNIAMLPPNVPGVYEFEIFCLPQLRVFNRKSIQGIKDILV